MSILDYFRNLLGVKRRDESGINNWPVDSHSHKFRNPIWQNDEDDDDIDDFRHIGGGTNFSIFHHPHEVTHFLEAEMDRMFKHFESILGHEFYNIHSGIHPEYPADSLSSTNSESNLRDKMLKSPEVTSSIAAGNNNVDADLNGKPMKEELADVWNNHSAKLETPQLIIPRGFSITRSNVCRPNGISEQKEIFMDSEGNTETKISRELGDKKYVVTTRVDKDGTETKSEDLINMNENELKDFMQKWSHPIKDDENGKSNSNLNRFPWDKFFGSDSKL